MDEAELEKRADELLAAVGRSPDSPAYTEAEMQRKGRREVSVPPEDMERIGGHTENPAEERVALALDVLARLDKRDMALVMLKMTGLTCREIATLTGKEEQAIEARLRRVRRQTRRQMREAGY